jgi:uncharacterized DUF497 family protein
MKWPLDQSGCGVFIDGIFWTWTALKAEDNTQKHHLSFELAAHVFSDPLSLTRLDEYPNEERFQTLGMIGNVHIIVVHTDPVNVDGIETGRIISARKAKPAERRAYANGNW